MSYRQINRTNCIRNEVGFCPCIYYQEEDTDTTLDVCICMPARLVQVIINTHSFKQRWSTAVPCRSRSIKENLSMFVFVLCPLYISYYIVPYLIFFTQVWSITRVVPQVIPCLKKKSTKFFLFFIFLKSAYQVIVLFFKPLYFFDPCAFIQI